MPFFGRLVASRAPVGALWAMQTANMSTGVEATFQSKQYKLHNLDSGPSTEVSVTRDDALFYYKQMQTVRRMETAAGNLYKEKKIRGFCHLYSGQEACAVGMRAASSDLDAFITSYRCHGWIYIMGGTIAQVLSELTGKMTGNVHGKGGSMHMYQKNFYGGNGIVGAQCPLGAGVAFAMKYRGDQSVCYTLYGDGAANQGQLYEALNMAKLWNLPCVFVCENNGYGMGTSAERSSASYEYYTRGDYIPGLWVDAMDVLGVREGARFARQHCLDGNGPIIMELATYRYSGHSMSDPGTSYRTRAEIQEVRKSRDPITGFKDRIVTAQLATEDELKQIDKEVRVEVDAAVKAANSDPEMPIESVYMDVYANTPGYTIRGVSADHTVTPEIQTTREFVKRAM